MAVKKRKISKFVAVTMAIFVVLYAVVFSTSLYVQKAAEQQCYDTLRKSTENLGKEIKNNIYSNQEQLEIIADVIASRGNADSEQTKHILKSYMTRGQISHLEVLLPDNRVITSDGNYADVSGILSYAEEVEKGEYVSPNSTVDISHGDKKVLKCAVPILKSGKTIGILYGIIEVDSLPTYYVAESYAENASIYLIDGDSGDFIMDTWHLSLGNIADWSNHKVKNDLKTSEIDKDIKSGKNGYLIGYSERAKENMYSYYTPVGINNWSVMLSIPESTVMKIAWKIKQAVYVMAVIMVIILVAYFLWLLSLRKKDINKVEYMLEVEKSLFDAHKHTENIENTLGTVADYMKAETAFFTKVKNGIIDEVYCWSNKDDFDINAAENKPVKVVIPGFNGDGTSMKFGKKLYNLRDYGLPYDYYIDSYIVTSVYDVKKRFVGVLGVVNMDKVWKNADYIENVAGTFSLAVNNISSYKSLREMGLIDYLTGLLVDTLKSEGIYDDTMIIFMSDHGDYTGDFGIVEKCQNCFPDCLTNVPFIIKPCKGERLDCGVNDNLVELTDMTATIWEEAGIKPNFRTQFGNSLFPMMKDKSLSLRDVVFCEGGRNPGERMCVENTREGSPYYARHTQEEQEDGRHGKAVMVRSKEFKYVYRLYEQDELYDLSIGESKNLIEDEKYAGVVLAMKEKALEWLVRTCDEVPAKRDSRFTNEFMYNNMRAMGASPFVILGLKFYFNVLHKSPMDLIKKHI